MTVDEIKNALAAQKPVLAQRFKVREIGVFGSYARNERGEGSDVDVLVSFIAPVGFFAFLDLEEYLEQRFSRRLNRHQNSLPPPATPSSTRPSVQSIIEDLDRISSLGIGD